MQISDNGTTKILQHLSCDNVLICFKIQVYLYELNRFRMLIYCSDVKCDLNPFIFNLSNKVSSVKLEVVRVKSSYRCPQGVLYLNARCFLCGIQGSRLRLFFFQSSWSAKKCHDIRIQNKLMLG